MSAPCIMLDCLPSLCQQLSDLVEVSRSYNKIILLVFFLRHGVLFIIFGLLQWYMVEISSS